MENRFIDMNLQLKSKAGRKRQTQTSNGSAAYSLSLSNGYSRQFGAVNFTVPGLVAPLRQPTNKVCWATVATMMIMWKRQASISIENAIASVGSSYLTMFKNNQALSAATKTQFLNDAGLAFEYPSSFSIEGWERLLKTYGPIWVTTEESAGIHARIITAISGDGTPDGTSLTIIDPARGNQYQEKFADFLVKYEREVIEAGASWSGRIQIVHWPAGASVAKSFTNERTHSWMISQRGIDLIKGFEAFRPNKYNDPVGHCTIGYGTLIHKGNCNGDASEQPYANGITEEQATRLLNDRLNEFQKTINDAVTIELNQNQYDSLVSFTYNVGSGNFMQSTLLRLLNQGNYASVPAELRKWTKARQNGQLVDLPGLVRRRNTEAELFQSTGTATSQSFLTSGSTARSFSAVNYTIPGILPELTQPSDLSCWATVITMMMSWKNNQSIPIPTAMAQIGSRYAQMFNDGRGLDKNTAKQLYADAGLVPIYSFNPTIEGWEGLLKQFGPLYVDVGYTGTFMTHAIIVKSIVGDGTADGTNISYVDPGIGRTVTLKFKDFLKKYEAEGAVRWPYTITHWPANAATSQSLSAYHYTYQFSNEVPLSPANGGRSIMASALEMGDIILSTTNQIPSGLIRFGTRAPVSHAMIYVGDGEQVVEAIGAGVTFRPLTAALGDASFAVAVRYPNLTQQQKLMIRDFAGQQIGKPYNTVGVVRNGVFQMDRSRCEPLRIVSESSFQACERWRGRIEMGTGSGDSYFCSELIVAAFNYAHVPLTNTPANWSSPGDLANLEFKMLNYVGHLKTT